MSDTPPAAEPPASPGPATPPPPADEYEILAGDPQPAPAAARRRLPQGWGAWLLVLAVAVTHLVVAIQSVSTGGVVPAIDDLRGEDLLVWLKALIGLFIRPDTAWDTSRLLALWMLTLMVTSIYASLRAGLSLPHGVLTFVGYGLTSAILLGLATPAVWYVFGDAGPVAAEFVPPVAMTAITALSLRNIES